MSLGLQFKRELPDDYRVAVRTILASPEPFYFYFGSYEQAFAFVRDIRKHGLKMGAAHFLPRSLVSIAIEGKSGLTIMPEPATAKIEVFGR